MRLWILPALLALLALSGLSFAQATVGEAISPFLFPSEPYGLEHFEYNGIGHLAVIVDGEYSLLFENSTGNYTLINDTTLLYTILRDWKMGDLAIDARVDAIREDILNFNFSRQPDEQLCRQYTGLIILNAQGGYDEKPCFYNHTASQPVESCLLACRTVPLCLSAIANQLPAIYNILYLKNATADIDSNVTVVLARIEQVRALDPFATDLALENLDNLIAAKDSVAANELFTIYGYCPPVDYNVTALTHASTTLSGIKSDFDYIESLGIVAGHIVNFSSQRTSLAHGEETYEVLLYNATVRLANVRNRINEALMLVNDPFTQNALDIAEYAYYAFGTAITAKEYLAADIAYHDFTVATENAEHAADSLEGRVNGVHSLLTNCTQTVYRIEQLDSNNEYLGTTTRLLTRLWELDAELNQTPMSINDFALLEANIKGACLDVGGVLFSVSSDFFTGKLAAINENLDQARNVSAFRGEELNDSMISELLRQANASILLGNFDKASELYDSALEASSQLLEAEQNKNAQVEAALAAVQQVEDMIAGMRSSISYIFVTPDVSAVERSLVRAKSMAYTNPVGSKALTEDAKKALEGAVNMVTLANYAIFGGILFFMFIVAAAAVGLVILKKKRII